MRRPIAFGALMGAMMLWMLHDPIMTGSFSLTLGAVAFVAAHIAVVVVAAALTLFFPKVRLVVRSHRPSLAHVTVMIGAMALTMSVVHLVAHGGLL